MATPSPRFPASGGPEEGSGTACIRLEAEVPEVLFDGMKEFITNHPEWDQCSLINRALTSFLFQNGCSEHAVTQHYLDGLFLLP